MGDLEKIIYTSAVTILGGVIVYIVGQLLSKLFIEPAYELRKTIGEVRFALSFHSPTILNPIGRNEDSSSKAKEALMKSSSDLLAKIHGIPAYEFVARVSCGSLPPRYNIEEAATQLRAVSTYVFQKDDKAFNSIDVITKRIEKIERLLGLKTLT